MVHTYILIKRSEFLSYTQLLALVTAVTLSFEPYRKDKFEIDFDKILSYIEFSMID